MTEILLVFLFCSIIYYAVLGVVYRHYSHKFEEADRAGGVPQPILIGAQVEEWHILMLALAALPLLLLFIVKAYIG